MTCVRPGSEDRKRVAGCRQVLDSAYRLLSAEDRWGEDSQGYSNNFLQYGSSRFVGSGTLKN
jgi:hypothetical protein